MGQFPQYLPNFSKICFDLGLLPISLLSSLLIGAVDLKSSHLNVADKDSNLLVGL
jgi:hypothetical protein